jgi:gamma-glutamyltranspeptidase / glutathione hydrolase
MKIYLLLITLLACSTQNTKTPSTRGNGPHSADAHTHYAIENKFMVVTQGEASSKAAITMLKRGGNLADAAVAASFAISVERPQSTGIGGGGFLIHSKNGKNKAFDFRERAPLKAHQNMFLDSQKNEIKGLSRTGHLAAGVPGFVKGMWDFHRQHGKLAWSEVLSPAIELAETGFKIYPHLARAIVDEAEKLKQDPDLLKTFYHTNGSPKSLGEYVTQPELASTLRKISELGADYFYSGEFAQKLAQSQKNQGALISLSDMKRYKVIERKVVEQEVFGHKIISMPPPSSGGTHVIQILNILEALNWQYQLHQPQTVHAMASSMQLAFYDRARYMGDPDFTNVPVSQLISKDYAKKLAQVITPERALFLNTEMEKKLIPAESTETTHLTLMSAEGEVITTTQTINGHFGAAVSVPGTGVILNNEMDDFATKVGASNMFGAIGGEPNLIQPFKTPLSSMSPTIVFKNNRPVLALGTPSGTRILTCVAQTIFNRLVLGLNSLESVASTRIHHQWKPDQITVELPGLNVETKNELTKLGHTMVEKDLGCKIQLIENTSKGLIGVSDHRGEGSALGLSI